jgi:AcrR family transcriptional regulator
MLAVVNISISMGAVSSLTSSSQTSRRGRPRAEDSPASSDELLLAALRAFATHGYDGTSIRELNQQLGVSHNLLNRRFGSKEQLWRATVDRFIGEVVTELAAVLSADETDPLETLRRLIVTFIEVQARRPEIARLLNVESSIDGPRLRYLYDQFIAPWSATADVLVDELVATGRIRPLPPGTLYFLVAYGATGMAAHPPFAKLVGVADPTDPAVIHAHAVAVADLVLTPPSTNT